MDLSKAQTELLHQIKSGANLVKVNNTWIKENVFLQLNNGECKRTNIKVVRKLIELKLIKEKEQTHSLIQEYLLNE